MVATAIDLTERRKAEGTMAFQARELQDIYEMTAPVVRLWDGIVCLPLMGMLDSRRTEDIMEALLKRIVETDSVVAIIDITGVPAVDTQTARHLLETISAVRLLGAQVIITGISPAISQTMVHLGIELSGVVTRSSLASGFSHALDLLDMKVMKRKPVQGGNDYE